jgi:hypothetical protein
MKITVTQSGGFAGLTQSLASLDTSALEPARAQQIEEKLRETRFFDLSANPLTEAVGADFLQYQIAVSDGERQHTVTFLDDDSAEAASLRELVTALINFGAE